MTLNHYPLLVADGKRIRKIASEEWVAQRGVREAAGFAYVGADNVAHPLTKNRLNYCCP